MYYVYRFLDESENIIYVGKSKQNLEQRFRGHGHLPKQCYDLVHKIEFIECPTESDMSIKEIYYINKYHSNDTFFNTLDVAELPTSVVFDDEWMMYEGALDSHFYKSINYTQGYKKETEIRYNKDGTVDKRKSGGEQGKSTYVEGFSEQDVNAIIEYIIKEINDAENDNQEQIRFRNLVMFILSINLPEKFNVLAKIRYKDLLDENNVPKAYALRLDSTSSYETIYIPLREIAKKILLAYIDYCAWSYEKNAEDLFFETRQHQTLSARTTGRILKGYAEAVGINKNIGSESMRKTYGLNIYEKAQDKIKALLFLGEIWGRARESQVIQYLNLTEDEVDKEYYLGETFSLGNVELEKISCLHRNNRVHMKPMASPKKMSDKTNKKIPTKTIKIWTADEKLEIVEKYLVQGIPQKILAEEYRVNKGAISQWVSAFKKYGKMGLESMKHQKMNTQEIDSEIKMEIVEKYVKKRISADILEKAYDVDKAIIYQWVREYTRYGREAFFSSRDIIT